MSIRSCFALVGIGLLLLSGVVALGQSNEQRTLRIAYNVLTDPEADNYEIYSMNLDGSDKRNVSNWKGVDWVYASYGGKVFFLSDRDNEHRKYNLYEMDAYGTNVRRINDFVLLDSWLTSRNTGSEFIVTSAKDGVKAFYLIDSTGRELAKVFSDTVRFNDPCFSPDGSQVAFRYSKSGRDEIWIMNVDGSDLKQLTHYPADQIKKNAHYYHAGPPRWEPNRNVISYISFQDGSYDIYTINPDGTECRQLTSNEFNHGWHDWSPDGSMIVLDGADLENKNFDIYLMSADSKEMTRLTTDSLYEQSPVFVRVTSPD